MPQNQITFYICMYVRSQLLFSNTIIFLFIFMYIYIYIYIYNVLVKLYVYFYYALTRRDPHSILHTFSKIV